ncbi:MAG: hypothetical protein IJU28_02370 [Clostridia bacterium]|nr:hypothetical protein [Clostridia bacterium]
MGKLSAVRLTDEVKKQEQLALLNSLRKREEPTKTQIQALRLRSAKTNKTTDFPLLREARCNSSFISYSTDTFFIISREGPS